MIAEVHQLKTKPVMTNWMCSACGIDAGCNCGAPLMSKAQRAAEAIAAAPHKSNVMIAEEIGVSEPTVRRARQPTSSDDEVEETRVGLDGKERRMPVREFRDGPDFTEKQSEEGNRNLFLLRADEAKKFAFYDGEVDDRVLKFAKATAEAWCDLVENLTRGK